MVRRSEPAISRRELFKGAAAAGVTAAGLMLPGLTPSALARPVFNQLLRQSGGYLVAAQEVDPVQLDPATSSNFSALQAYEHVYESLVMYDENTNIIPCLAESWETPDDTSYVFYLRKGVKFHDGSQMTAADVVYSLERAAAEATGSPWRSLLTPITSFEIRDPYTLKVNLKQPFPALLGNLAVLRNSGIMPKGFAERANTKLQAVGTGPFKLTEYVPTDYLTYERFADYWDKPRPYLDKLTLKILLDQNARIAALLSGQVQYAVLDAQGAEQAERLPGVKVLKSPSAWLTCHPFNLSRKPFDDKRVRQALRMAVDTQEVIQKAVYGAGLPSGAIATGYGDWALPESELKYLKADPDRAKQLLAEAGFPNGFKTSILCSPQYPEFVATSLVCQDSWRKIGVDCEVQQVEWGTYVNRASKAAGYDYDIGATAFTFRPDPDGYVYPYYKTGEDINNGYSDPQMDQWLDRARTTLNREERRQLYLDIQRKLEEDVPQMYWYVRFNIEAISDRVQGYKQSFTQRRIFFKDTRLS